MNGQTPVVWQPQPRQRAFMERPRAGSPVRGRGGRRKKRRAGDRGRCGRVHIPHYRALILRKTFPQLSDLMDKSMNYYTLR